MAGIGGAACADGVPNIWSMLRHPHPHRHADRGPAL